MDRNEQFKALEAIIWQIPIPERAIRGLGLHKIFQHKDEVVFADKSYFYRFRQMESVLFPGETTYKLYALENKNTGESFDSADNKH